MMAFIENIIQNETSIDEILELKQRNGAKYIKANTAAAIIIQRNYRGYYTRSYIFKLNSAALMIQKHWKGYIARRYNHKLIKILSAHLILIIF